MQTDKVVQQQLIQKGKTQGYITYDEILAVIPSAEQNLELLEALMEDLTQTGIAITPQPPAPEAAPELEEIEDAEPELPTDEELEELDPLEIALTNDAGYQAAMDADDVVGLCLKEAGRVPLL